MRPVLSTDVGHGIERRWLLSGSWPAMTARPGAEANGAGLVYYNFLPRLQRCHNSCTSSSISSKQQQQQREKQLLSS